MQIGVVFPQTEIGADVGAVRSYAQRVEELGFAHLLAYDHVVGADPAVHTGWSGPYNIDTTFHEPFVLFGFLAAVTQHVELVTGILILPQRQTALVAKQAAAVDVLSRGRLRLGVGVGWNSVEFEALGENFKNRGKRIEEQITVMRELWAKELVTVEGEWHRITDAGINPLPSRRSIPIWMGGESPVVMHRAARMADGWMPHFRPGPEAQAVVDRLHEDIRKAGRDPARFGIEGRMALAQVPPEQQAKELAAWRAMRGITHLCIHTVGMGLKSPDEHVKILEQFRKDVLS
jgi:probable F420-dependent oxidoreductase